TATLKDAGTCVGDIRTAKVSFYVRDPIAGTLSPINGAQNLPVGLVNPGDTTVGTASATVQYNISGSAQGLVIAVVVGGNYAANNPTTDQLITIAVPVAGGQICGGGTINNAADFGSSGM